MAAKHKERRVTRNLKLTRAHKILALILARNACSDENSSVPPSPASSLIALNLLDSTTDSDQEQNDERMVCVPLTPTFNEVFPSPNTNNYNAIPTLNSIQSLPSPTVEHPLPGTSQLQQPLTRSKRKKTTKNVIAKKVKVKKLVLDYHWSKEVFRHSACLEENLYEIHQTCINTVLDYFFNFFSPDIIGDIVHNTNLYAVQQLGRSIQLTEDEIKNFLAIHIMMGIVHYTEYWGKRTRYPLIADLMPLKRYQQIRRYIHFADNTLEDSDRYFKICPIMEKIRQNFLQVEEEGKYSIDEIMIPYKGRKAGKRKQYVKMKPKKWGFKNFVRAGVSGIIYDFLLYGVDDTFRGLVFTEKEATIGLGGMVVIALCQTIKKKPAIAYADNFFMSPGLTHILREEYGIFSLGTIRTNRLRGCQALLPTDQQFKKKKRGSSAQVVCNKNKLAVVKWHDNKVVTLISSYMRDGKEMHLKDFRFELFEGLTKHNRIVKNINVTEDIDEGLKIHKPVSVRPTESVRFDDKGHLPEAGDETMRCKYCKSGRTTVYCIKCNVHLCFVVGKQKRNCFRNFHTK
ncbi:hypothetical protein SFRURICE_001515 [Spodoptera frugiperda]|nr:hypothetical protein SFRURICE_001515 [Spodoptera frugiperda]